MFGLGTAPAPGVDDELIADLGEQDRIAAWLREIRPTHCVHLAALSHVASDPIELFRINVLGTDALLEAIVAAGLSPAKIVVASSANIYGNAESSPIGEDAPIRPANYYGLSKASMELALTKWQGRLPIVVARPFNYTGPEQSERFVFAKIVGAFRRKEAKLVLGNTNVSRDLSDVRDICAFYCALLERAEPTTTVNLCSGTSVSLKEVIEVMVEMVGYRPEIEVDPALVRTNEIITLCGDARRLESVIGPVVRTPLRSTLKDMYLHAD